MQFLSEHPPTPSSPLFPSPPDVAAAIFHAFADPSICAHLTAYSLELSQQPAGAQGCIHEIFIPMTLSQEAAERLRQESRDWKVPGAPIP